LQYVLSIIPIADRHLECAYTVLAVLKDANIHTEIDGRSERMNAKIREAQLQKIPYMLMVGDKEQQAQAVSVRLRANENLGAIPLATFVARITNIIGTRSNAL
jgi:threonyl-tRNA synthetase